MCVYVHVCMCGYVSAYSSMPVYMVVCSCGDMCVCECECTHVSSNKGREQ